MTKSRKRSLPFNYRHIIAGAISLGFALIAIFCFPYAFKRLIEAGRDLGLSVAFYFCELFEIPHRIRPTVTEPSAFSLPLPFSFPDTFGGFKTAFFRFWKVFANGENVKRYIIHVRSFLFHGSRWIILLAPLPIIFGFGFAQTDCIRPDDDFHADFDVFFELAQVFVFQPDAAFAVGGANDLGLVCAVDADAGVRRGLQTDEPVAVSVFDDAFSVFEVMRPGTGVLDLLNSKIAFGRAHVAHFALVAGHFTRGHAPFIDDLPAVNKVQLLFGLIDKDPQPFFAA